MISISDAIIQILSNDFESKACFLNGTINLSQYAKQIQLELENLVFKKIRTQSIVVSLYRLQAKCQDNSSLLNTYSKPHFTVSQVTCSINLVEFTVHKTQQINTGILTWMTNFDVSAQEFFSYTIGQTEITFICTQKVYDELQAKQIINPKDCLVVLKDLGAASIKFGNYVLDQPNIVFEILKIMALENINIVEIVSTAKELSVIVSKTDIPKLTAKFQELLLI